MLFRTLIFYLLFIIPLSSFGLGSRSIGEIDFGLTGGYGFPQIGNWQMSSLSVNHGSFSKNSKEYNFGLAASFFVLDSLSLTGEAVYHYQNLDFKHYDLSWKGYFTDISFIARYYWFDLLYLGAGVYGQIPMGKSQSYDATLRGLHSFVSGAIAEVGVDLKLLDHFGLRLGLRSYIIFTPHHDKGKNYLLKSYPIDFNFGLNFIL